MTAGAGRSVVAMADNFAIMVAAAVAVLVVVIAIIYLVLMGSTRLAAGRGAAFAKGQCR